MLDTPPEQPRAAPASNPMTFGAGRTKAHSHAELSDEWMTEVRGGARARPSTRMTLSLFFFSLFCCSLSLSLSLGL